MAVWAKQYEVFASIVPAVTVRVVKFQGQRLSAPFGKPALGTLFFEQPGVDQPDFQVAAPCLSPLDQQRVQRNAPIDGYNLTASDGLSQASAQNPKWRMHWSRLWPASWYDCTSAQS